MIVISGALVLVALVLLIIGVVSTSLPFVYASIAVSLVSLVFLVIGILQRRGETVPVAEGAGAATPQPAEEPADSVTAVIPSQGSRRVTPARAADAEPAAAGSADEELEVGGTVLVVAGRPRYHVGGCRYLTGKAAEPIDVRDAREEGFSPCGVCKPDDSLEQAAAVGAAPADGKDVVQEDVPGVDVPPARRAAAGGTRAVTGGKDAPAKAAKSAAKTAAKPAASRAGAGTGSSARKAPATKSAAPAKAAKTPARSAAAKAPSRAATAAAAASPASQSAAKRPGSVVVIPDRGKFHTADCRYVRDVEDAEVLSKTAARREGYTACGVCKP